METLSTILSDGKPLPELVVFDLDETLWPFWCISMVKKPITKHSETGVVSDRTGKIVSLYKGAYDIVHKLHCHGLTLGIASRTTVEAFAKEVLAALDIGEFFTHGVCGDITKKHHFKELCKQSAVDYKEMLFFDNDMKNIHDVSEMGVVSIHVKDGLSLQDVVNGLRKFRLSKGDTSY